MQMYRCNYKQRTRGEWKGPAKGAARRSPVPEQGGGGGGGGRWGRPPIFP